MGKHQLSNKKRIIKIGGETRKFFGNKHKKNTVELRKKEAFFEAGKNQAVMYSAYINIFFSRII